MDEQENPGGAGPLAEGSSFEQVWDAAQAGEYVVNPPPSIGGDEDGERPRPVATQAEPTPADRPAPASDPAGSPAPGQGQGSPDWTPPTRDEYTTLAEKARRFDSINGNFPQIEEKWKAQHLAPIEAEKQRLEAEATRLRTERTQILDAYLQTLPPAVAQQRRDQIAQYDTEIAAALEAEHAARQKEAELTQREQRVSQIEQEAREQQLGNLRAYTEHSLGPYTDQLAQQYQIPREEVEGYIQHLQLPEFIRTTADLKAVGPLLYSVQQFAAFRAGRLAAENAQRAQQGGTYRPEGNAGRAGGGRRSVADLPDTEFFSFWNRVKEGNSPNA